jgi:hypothetical protein
MKINQGKRKLHTKKRRFLTHSNCARENEAIKSDKKVFEEKKISAVKIQID